MKREEIIRRFRESAARTRSPQLQSLTSAQARREYARQQHLLDRYAAALSDIAVSRCPICAAELRLKFDAQGLDGMWWLKDATVPAQTTLESHHRLVLGAIDFHGREPAEAADNGHVMPGPGVPFVIPRILEMDGMQAVISCLDLPRGDTAFVINYFSPEPVNPFRLHQPWAREHLLVDEDRDPSGRGGWGQATDHWDFELQPWIDAGKLKWIEPGDGALALRDQGPCPYLNLPGVRQPQQIVIGRIELLPLPDGTPFDPFD